MTDEEVREIARDLLIDELSAFPNWFRDYEHISGDVNEDGMVTFQISVAEPGLGSAQISFTPQPFLETLIRSHADLLDKMREEGVSEKDIVAAEFYLIRERDETVSILMRNMRGEFIHTVALMGPLANQLFLEGASNETEAAKDQLSQVQKANADLDKQRKAAHDFFRKEVENSGVAHPAVFAILYDVEIDRWRQAKKCFRENAGYPNALEMVRVAFPDRPGHILDLLADPDNYANSPEALALKSTAEIAGLPGKKISKRSMQDYLRTSRNTLATMTPEQIQNQLEHFLGFHAYQRDVRETLEFAETDDPVN